jgi:hypothetical protein
MNNMPIENFAREEVASYLLNEIWGPSFDLPDDAVELPAAAADGVVYFTDAEQDVKYFDPATKQLLIQGMRPEVLYGTGILHAPDAMLRSTSKADADDEAVLPDMPVPDIKIVNHLDKGADDGEESFALDQSQKLRPSAFGLTFRVGGPSTSKLKIAFTGAIYKPVKVHFAGYAQSTWFRRVEISSDAEIDISKLHANLDTLLTLESSGAANEFVSLLVRARASVAMTDGSLTITVVAKHLVSSKANEDVLQAEIKVSVSDPAYFAGEITSQSTEDEELAEIDFLYRHVKNYGTGHGISVEWDEIPEGEKLREIRTIAVPKFYQEVLTFDATSEKFLMGELANDSDEVLKAKLQRIIDSYRSWVENQKTELLDTMQGNDVSAGLIAKAEHILERMDQGLTSLFEPKNSKMLEAFKLANQAMYLQQRNGKKARREWAEFVPRQRTPLSYPKSIDPDPSKYGTWRQFQIGFLLLSINGLLDYNHLDREEVDLIFFPTGGGKTEAYLGASALTIIYRRLTQQDEVLGVDILMRYTLRLLTIQQFERSAGLITALEYMRRQDVDKFGTKPISIGVWLGAATTPNTRDDVKALFNKGQTNKYDDTNPFILSRCPWCGAAFGWDLPRKQWNGYDLIGSPKTLRFRCADRICDFSDDEAPLPIWITDEDVYAQKPSFILGTVDKFARMAWKPEARSLFNLNIKGERIGPPPALVIQDELHLISGPLGSMVGLYEPVIEELCTDYRITPAVRPKIIASTATTRKYENQIFSLYGRNKVTLFPQAVNRANETFFSSVDRDESGKPKKGTLYLGINPATYATGQMAASVVAAVLMQAPNQRPESDEQMDYYRTSMWFFNSLRELGMTLTLMQSVVLDRIRGMSLYRRLPQGAKPRWPSTIMELTSRVPSSQISNSLKELGLKAWEKGSVSTCLASSIMEVGVDVGRLGLLTIMSQPKATAQYIQVSGRVGRERESGPGLVIMLYNAQRARDRSVYERFATYHSKLYAQVEPVTVTPFSIPAMRHGLVGALLSHYRMTCLSEALPSSVNEDVFLKSVEVLRTRLQGQSPDALKLADFEKQVLELKAHWKRYGPGRWNYSMEEEKGAIPANPAPALMRSRREPLIDYPADESMLVPSSLRSVDGQTEIKVSHNPYVFDDSNEE